MGASRAPPGHEGLGLELELSKKLGWAGSELSRKGERRGGGRERGGTKKRRAATRTDGQIISSAAASAVASLAIHGGHHTRHITRRTPCALPRIDGQHRSSPQQAPTGPWAGRGGGKEVLSLGEVAKWCVGRAMGVAAAGWRSWEDQHTHAPSQEANWYLGGVGKRPCRGVRRVGRRWVFVRSGDSHFCARRAVETAPPGAGKERLAGARARAKGQKQGWAVGSGAAGSHHNRSCSTSAQLSTQPSTPPRSGDAGSEMPPRTPHGWRGVRLTSNEWAASSAGLLSSPGCPVSPAPGVPTQWPAASVPPVAAVHVIVP
ncbi:hypothetical protein GGTG_14081 [Gaeumannomyces tritici R3-111a-1]|uniref:Uncharacterized protein n=1 Tax=Gaeumannomyces tritici (strain R3-111a-1) TaxID=644352 RepID=J3PKL8_GAET3|nr:hypothetical protein GGTG_14081 [Gaeumannomyces tritici R3-111a-1]EJT68343.1 hypothetical protein GGTG_14081 [Gaeumannomyces tritici R3-111a-1]